MEWSYIISIILSIVIIVPILYSLYVILFRSDLKLYQMIDYEGNWGPIGNVNNVGSKWKLRSIYIRNGNFVKKMKLWGYTIDNNGYTFVKEITESIPNVSENINYLIRGSIGDPEPIFEKPNYSEVEAIKETYAKRFPVTTAVPVVTTAVPLTTAAPVTI
jgi:hypothetical protein